MRILLTGGTGYIGKRLLPVLLEQGHTVICCTRNAARLELDPSWDVLVFEHDFLDPVTAPDAPLDFEIAFYLLHSMSASIRNFEPLEAQTARNFVDYVSRSSAQQIIYLTGIVNAENLSRHLQSRLRVEEILNSGRAPLTALRAGIIVGSGSASFEIIRDLVEKLPVMITPKWLNTRCSPVAIRNVIQYLTGVMGRKETFGRDFDIGGADVLTYKEMLLTYAKVRRLRRWIVTVPVMTPRLSSFWLYFVTATTYELAVNLVDSMKVDVIPRDRALEELLGIEAISYQEAVKMAFDKIEQNSVVSSWKDSLIHSSKLGSLEQFVNIPRYGCFRDYRMRSVEKEAVAEVWDNILHIGGDRGWYYGNWFWRLRGVVDKLVGGIGLRRGRTRPDIVFPGDSLDFWRVLVANGKERRLLLYAEMKLPGEAWLEFEIKDEGEEFRLHQTATFRPAGVLGRLYWYAVVPFHYLIFNGMVRNIIRFRPPTAYQPTANEKSKSKNER